MRHQAVTGDIQQSTLPGRPDPAHLPASYAIAAGNRGGSARYAVTLHRDRAVVTNREGSTTLPVRAFRGVAVRMEASGDDSLRVVLELNHENPALSILLLEAEDPADVVADWQSWSRELGLPMLLFEADGSFAQPVPQIGGVMLRPVIERRPRSGSQRRRPRFLARRKAGWDRGDARVDGQEIIARR